MFSGKAGYIKVSCSLEYQASSVVFFIEPAPTQAPVPTPTTIAPTPFDTVTIVLEITLIGSVPSAEMFELALTALLPGLNLDIHTSKSWKWVAFVLKLIKMAVFSEWFKLSAATCTGIDAVMFMNFEEAARKHRNRQLSLLTYLKEEKQSVWYPPYSLVHGHICLFCVRNWTWNLIYGFKYE